MSSRSSSLPDRVGAHAVIAVLWLLHWLPLPVLAALGRGLGALLWHVAPRRRRVAQRNLALCFPDWPAAQREAVAHAHFGWLGRSLLERGLLSFASTRRLRRLIEVVGPVHLAEQTPGPFMWLLPHFVGLEWFAPALSLSQTRHGVDVYQRQSNPVFDAHLMRTRGRFGTGVFVDRHEGIRPVLRYIKQGYAFVNAPDMDFGAKDAAFVPFFAEPAATLLAPGRMAASMGMTVQPIVVTLKPGGRGYRVEAHPPIAGYPSGDPERDARTFNAWLEARILAHPAQYLWVHRRFKTRPPGRPPAY